jgi:membrane protease YdiL (CAAX protease family)
VSPAIRPNPPVPAVPGGRRRISWGIGDVIAAWFAGLLVSVVASAALVGTGKTTPIELSVLIVAQDGATIGWLALVARRKGLGSLEADFGLRAVERGKTWANNVRWFFLGIGLQLAWLPALVLLQEVHGEVPRQEVVRVAERSSGLAIPLIFLAVGVLAPVAEELLFRGALLRSLLRKTTPGWAVFISAAVFGLVHFGDPSIGTLFAFPAIVSLGLISGYQATKTGDLANSVMLHMGFNIVTVILLLAEIA